LWLPPRVPVLRDEELFVPRDAVPEVFF